jgi:TusE/DsrC/DsvC family sulfur relay protein
MPTRILAGQSVDLSDEGYFNDASQWTQDMATELATEVGISITPKHSEVINYLRDRYTSGQSLTIRRIGKSGIVDIKGFYALFPGGPLKVSSKIAGIPKPASCV